MSQIAKEYQRKSNDGIKNFLANISIIHLIIFVVVLGIIIYVSQKKGLDPKWNYLMYGFLVVIILVLYFKQGPVRRPLPLEEVIKIADAELKRMVRDGNCFPFDSKVYLTGKFDLKSKDDLASGWSGYTHYELGFVEMVKGSQFKKDNIIKIHAYEGISLGIHEAPLGYSGNESASVVRTVPVAVFQGSVASDDMGNSGNIKR